jgi:hypothetical protein
MKYLKYSREIIITVAVIWIILLLFGPCGNHKINQEYKALKAEAKQLKDKVMADSAARERERVSEKGQMDEQRRQTEAAKADKKAADFRLSQTQATVIQLASKLQPYRNQKPDSSFTTVHPDYVKNCDTLAAKVIEQDGQINAYKAEVDETMELLNYEVVLRDSVIEKEIAYSDSLRAAFNRQSGILENALTVGRPRGKLLAGAGVIGNQTTFLSGAKVSLAYQTKGGKQYQAGGLLIGNTIYYEATVMVPLFK